MLTVCMHCHKILRPETETRSWSEIPEEERRRASHGLCEACLEKYYPGEEEDETEEVRVAVRGTRDGG